LTTETPAFWIASGREGGKGQHGERSGGGVGTYGDETRDGAHFVVDGLEGGGDELGVADVALVGFGLHAILFTDLLRDILGILRAPVDEES
jgi:hypothetical protein